jgi:ComF family protein
MSILQRITGTLLDLVLDRGCLICQRSTPHTLCPYCQRQIQACRTVHLQAHLQSPDRSIPLLVWGDYGGPLRQAIAQLKYHNCPQLAVSFGHWMGQAWQATAGQLPLRSRRPTVIPIPMHRDKQRQRGYNQAERLATAFCAITTLPLARQGLIRDRATRPQFELSPAERQQNLHQAFRLGHLPRSPDGVILLDDIYTTGATIRAAIATLEHHQIPVHGVIVFACPRSPGQERSPQGIGRPLGIDDLGLDTLGTNDGGVGHPVSRSKNRRRIES